MPYRLKCGVLHKRKGSHTRTHTHTKAELTSPRRVNSAITATNDLPRRAGGCKEVVLDSRPRSLRLRRPTNADHNPCPENVKQMQEVKVNVVTVRTNLSSEKGKYMSTLSSSVPASLFSGSSGTPSWPLCGSREHA